MGAPSLLPVILVFAGLVGLAIGSFLNVVIYRVPAGIALTRPSRCPSCAASVRPWQNVPVVSWIALRGRCASCGGAISPRYPMVEAATALAFVVLAWMLADGGGVGIGIGQHAAGTGIPPASGVPLGVAFLYFAAISIALTLIDLDTRRLPDAIVLPSYPVLAILLTTACVLGAPWEALLRAAVGGAVLFAFYFALRVARPGGMGGGDVKLAGVIGVVLGWVGWGALAVGAFAAFVFGGVFGVALLLTRRATRTTAVPFGPWMILGAWAGILVGEQLAGGYLRLLGAS
jgi:leader peptidase (prepilin peptidase)/N-methyltransferase